MYDGNDLSLAARGESSGGGTLFDPYFFLFVGTGVAAGNQCETALVLGDDCGCGLDSYVETTQPAGTYTVAICETANRLGTYRFERNTFTGAEVCP